MADHGIDVHEELASPKVSGFHLRLGLIMALLTLFDGYDTFNPAYVIHYVAGPWGVKGGQAGLLISSGLVGFLVGSAAHGIIADRLGRRGTLLGGLWITSIFTLLTALFADSFASFCVMRLLTGLGLGVLLPLATTYINAQRVRFAWKSTLREKMQEVDVLVTPTLPNTAMKVGESVSKIGSKEETVFEVSARFCAPFNMAGLPAASIPCGFAPNGLPIGLQIVGKPFDEEMVLRVGHAFESDTDYHLRRPPLSGHEVSKSPTEE